MGRPFTILLLHVGPLSLLALDGTDMLDYAVAVGLVASRISRKFAFDESLAEHGISLLYPGFAVLFRLGPLRLVAFHRTNVHHDAVVVRGVLERGCEEAALDRSSAWHGLPLSLLSARCPRRMNLQR